jgi:hypothetical protein|tara:strand:- start:1699 stop:2019 length:321 start_codon:yes stop_codon:yes gene_type:complete
MKAVQKLSLIRMIAAGLFLMMIVGCEQQVTADEIGNVQNPVVVENCAAPNEGDKPQCAHSPNAIFDQAALNAIRQSKYEPVVMDGVATTSQGLTRVEFWFNSTTNN